MDNSKLKKRSLSQEDLFNLSELFKLMKPRVMSLVIPQMYGNLVEMAQSILKS